MNKDIRKVLLMHMEIDIKRIESLLENTESKEFEYRPDGSTRNLIELIRHLVLIPKVDLATLQGQTKEVVQRLSEEADEVMEIAEFLKILKKGFDSFSTYFLALSEEELIWKITAPYYSIKAISQAEWLVESTCHIHLHCVELYNFRQQLGDKKLFFELV